eukprot:15484084-Alexandrium_andersonii.AAC.1
MRSHVCVCVHRWQVEPGSVVACLGTRVCVSHILGLVLTRSSPCWGLDVLACMHGVIDMCPMHQPPPLGMLALSCSVGCSPMIAIESSKCPCPGIVHSSHLGCGATALHAALFSCA